MTDTQDTTGRMPALYIGHGAPPLLDDPVWSQELRTWALDLPRPRAILTVSAHEQGTGKSESISITNDKGRLTPEEIERMVALCLPNDFSIASDISPNDARFLAAFNANSSRFPLPELAQLLRA